MEYRQQCHSGALGKTVFKMGKKWEREIVSEAGLKDDYFFQIYRRERGQMIYVQIITHVFVIIKNFILPEKN